MEIKEIKFIKSIIEYEKEYSPLAKEKKKIYFLGRSNVGKSSMINSVLWWKEFAYSGAKAGKTRTINIFEVNKKYECLDFPGYWFATWSKWNKINLRDMILDYLEKAEYKQAKAVLIIDAFVWPTELDEEIYNYLYRRWLDILVVMNKVDKTTQKELEQNKIKAISSFINAKFILYSCKDKNKKYRDAALSEIFN